MTPEEEIDVEIARSIINDQIADLARVRAWELVYGSKSLVLEIEDTIIRYRNIQYSLTPDEARQVLEAGKMFKHDSYFPKKFEMASTELVKDLRPEVDEILLVLGHPEALVTDLSTLGDFLPDIDCEEAKSLLAYLESVFEEQQMLNLSDTLVSWARAIRREFDGRR